ncbi:MAG TPA: F0F1 ATP synthase subunit epsilon [Pyrinomonadaceae bacterium]|jgi:F-type H+-transporting ATPase subunit epsilon|nr:F0F1 ATP synthase subunit epsilon [Pyrinomonadaceae bacterium]
MAERIQLDVITPERSVLSEAVDFVSVPGLGGELGILPGHTPLISQLQTGVLSYTQGGTSERLLVSGGFVEVNHDRVSVLADLAERPEEIDSASARQAREQAERALAAFTGDEADFARARAELDRADARLQLADSNPARA